MADAFIGEVRIFASTYAPIDWAQCNGQIFNSNQNPALYAVIQNIYGGQGPQTFAVPNLQGRAIIGAGAASGRTPQVIGTPGGQESVAVTASNLPPHSHLFNTGTTATTGVSAAPVAGYYLGHSQGASGSAMYIANSSVNTTLAPQTIGPSGQSAAHENRQPYLPMIHAICVNGTFPTRS